MCLLSSCFEETGYLGPSANIKIEGTVTGANQTDGFYVLPRNTKFEIKFDITTSDFIKRIEVYKIKGIPANTDRDDYQPESSLINLMERRGVPEGLETTNITVSDTMTLGEEEVTYSVYVEDINSEFNVEKVFVLTDIAKFTNTLQDGNPDGLSATFLSLTSGRSFYVYNTVQDPKGIDLGFVFLESINDAKACLISLDEYWRAGSYAGIANDNYYPMEFRNAIPEDSLRFDDLSVTPDDLQLFFERGTQYPVPERFGFTPGKIATKIKRNEVIAFKIRNAYHGLMFIQQVSTHSRPDYTQEISLTFIVQRKTNYN